MYHEYENLLIYLNGYMLQYMNYLYSRLSYYRFFFMEFTVIKL